MPKVKKRLGPQSSMLVYRAVIISAFLAALLANRFGMGLLAVLLLTISMLGAVSRLWGLHSLRRVEVSLTAERTTLSVGDNAVISYSVTNNKILPVMWLELCQDVPQNNCLSPDSGFSKYEVIPQDVHDEVKTFAYRRRMVFLWSFQTIGWDTVWSAKRRGIYIIDRLTLQSGDGFGFTQGTQALDVGGRILVVWPRIVPVVTSPFFRNVWQGPTGRQGHVEDPTVLRGLRDYMPGDPWKRIDWRVAARQDEIQVRRFETMLPGSLHFILDVGSFLNLSEENDELEDSISVLASLILELDGMGIRCGISLPQGPLTPPVDISPESPDANGKDLLYALSALDADKATGGFDVAAVESISQAAGHVWLVTHSGERLTCPRLVEKLESIGFSALCHEKNAAGILAGRRILGTTELRVEK